MCLGRQDQLSAHGFATTEHIVPVASLPTAPSPSSVFPDPSTVSLEILLFYAGYLTTFSREWQKQEATHLLGLTLEDGNYNLNGNSCPQIPPPNDPRILYMYIYVIYINKIISSKLPFTEERTMLYFSCLTELHSK